jgi:uncharacterized repeat protein (TIGR03809 family)
MANRLDAAKGRDIVARWCNLAEQRLEHLTELFESGRWRRYHTERAFLENIQEAKAAVETWRDLLRREDMAIDISRLSHTTVTIARRDELPPHIVSFPPRAAPVLAAPEAVHVTDAPITSAPAVLAVNAAAFRPAAPATDTSPEDVLEPMLDVASMQRRYPLLRNAL